MARVSKLVCRECDRAAPIEAYVCEHCFGPLDVAYDADELARVARRDPIAAGPPSLWRFAALLPDQGPPVAGEHAGLTPLVRARRLAAAWGLDHLYLKDEGANHPTGSFKDRAVAVAVGQARALGLHTVACASTGNLGRALAAQAARAGLRALVLVPSGADEAHVDPIQRLGAWVIEVEGAYDEASRLAAAAADLDGLGVVNVNLRPYFAEGLKTVGHEIGQQLGWRVPAHVVVPCASGMLLCQLRRGLSELERLGLVTGSGTRMHAAQPAGSAPIVAMVERGSDELVPVEPKTVCRSLAFGSPADGHYAARTVRATGGAAVRVADQDALAAMRLLARTEGLITEPAGGVALAAARTLVETGRIGSDEPVVVCLTGRGGEAVEVPASPVPPIRIPPSLAALERVLTELRREVRPRDALNLPS